VHGVLSALMKRTVTTTGTGTVRVVPDAAVVTVGARDRAGGVADACAAVDAAVATIGQVARRHTEPSSIASTGLTVWPQRDREGLPSGYEARHTLRIRLADVAVAGRLLADLAEEVGDRLAVDGVALTVSEPTPALTAAREAAFTDARAKAEELAALSGAALGEVLTVSESDHGVARPVALAARGATPDMSLEPGDQGVSTTVTVTWRMS
jgi:uncharacterized protein